MMAGMPPPGQGGPTPEQVAQMQRAMAAEAQRRGMTPQAFQAQQKAAIEAEAAKQGLSVPEFVQRLRMQAMAQQRQMQAQQQGQAGQAGQPGQTGQMPPPGQPGQPPQPGQPGQPPQQHQHQHPPQPQPGQQVPIQPGPPNPQAIAVAQWLQGQDLKTRTCILNGQRKTMFKGIHSTSFKSKSHHLTIV